MKKAFINPSEFYSSGRAYSQAIKYDLGSAEIIFITGQIAKDQDGKVVGIGNIEKQTEYIFERIKTILEETGATIDDLVKVTIYLVKMEEFEKVSAVRNKYLKKSKPAATTIGITATVSKGCDIEIDAIAIKGRNK